MFKAHPHRSLGCQFYLAVCRPSDRTTELYFISQLSGFSVETFVVCCVPHLYSCLKIMQKLQVDQIAPDASASFLLGRFLSALVHKTFLCFFCTSGFDAFCHIFLLAIDQIESGAAVVARFRTGRFGDLLCAVFGWWSTNLVVNHR